MTQFKNFEQYQAHADKVLAQVQATYGNNIANAAVTYTQLHILLPIMEMGAPTDALPDPEFIVSSVAKSLSQYYKKTTSVPAMVKGLCAKVQADLDVLAEILEDASELTLAQGFKLEQE